MHFLLILKYALLQVVTQGLVCRLQCVSKSETSIVLIFKTPKNASVLSVWFVHARLHRIMEDFMEEDWLPL